MTQARLWSQIAILSDSRHFGRHTTLSFYPFQLFYLASVERNFGDQIDLTLHHLKCHIIRSSTLPKRMATRSRTQSGLSRADEVEYFLCIEGVRTPRHYKRSIELIFTAVSSMPLARTQGRDSEDSSRRAHPTSVHRR